MPIGSGGARPPDVPGVLDSHHRRLTSLEGRNSATPTVQRPLPAVAADLPEPTGVFLGFGADLTGPQSVGAGFSVDMVWDEAYTLTDVSSVTTAVDNAYMAWTGPGSGFAEIFRVQQAGWYKVSFDLRITAAADWTTMNLHGGSNTWVAEIPPGGKRLSLAMVDYITASAAQHMTITTPVSGAGITVTYAFLRVTPMFTLTG